jgi:hypothetical protein
MWLFNSYGEFRESLVRDQHIALFEWVDWSQYARDLGFAICETAEKKWNAEHSFPLVTWCYGDFSSTSSPMTPVYDLLFSGDLARGKRVANVGTGNGAIFWIGNGILLDVSRSAYQMGVEAVSQEASRHFKASA